MKRKLIGIPLAALLLVGGATVVLAQTGPGAAVAEAKAQATAGVGSLLTDVLDDLVADGTIEQAQADAITDAVQTRHVELRAEAEALHEQMRTFLEDGTLSPDELAQLPADHPLRNLDAYLDDGRLTEDELRSLRGFGFGPARGAHGHGQGHGQWGGPGVDRPTPDASAEPDA